MKKLILTIEDIHDSTFYEETTKMVQKTYDETGFIPSVFDCISPSPKENDIIDYYNKSYKPNEIDFYVAERWLRTEGNILVLFVTTEKNFKDII